MTRFERLRREEKARARREEIAKYELADRKRRYGEQVRKEYKPHVSEKARAQLLKRKDVARPGFEEYHADSLDALSPGAAGTDATPALPRIVPNREVAHERGQEVFFEYDVHGRKVLVDPYEEHDMYSPFRPQRPGAKLAPSPRRPRQKQTPREEPLIKNPARRPAPDQNVRHSQEMTPAEHLERLGEERHRLERELLSVEYTYRNGRLIGRPVQRQSFGSPVATAQVPSRGHPSWPESAGTDGYVGGGEFIPQDYIPQAAFDEIPVGGGNAVGNAGGGVLSETAVNRHAAREDQERKKGKGFRTMLRERQLAAVEARMSHEQTPTPPPRPKPEFANRPAPRRHPPPPPPPPPRRHPPLAETPVVPSLTPEELEELIANAGPDDVPPQNVRLSRPSFSAVYDESPMPKPKRRTEPEAPQLSPTQLQAIMDTAGPDDVPPIVGSVGARAVSWEDRPAMSRANYEATRALAEEEEAARVRAEEEGERLARLSGGDEDVMLGVETLVAADTLPPGVGIGGTETDEEEEDFDEEDIDEDIGEEVDAGDSPGGIDLAVAEETNRADDEIGDDVASGEEEDGEAHDEEEDDVGEEHAADHDDEEEAADEDEDAAEEMKKDEHGDEEKNQ